MDFNFENLTPNTREFMLKEFENDEKNGKVYVSRRIKNDPITIKTYIRLLTEAFRNGTDSSLCKEIQKNNIFNNYENYMKNGKLITKKIPSNAHEILGQGEFKRYYMRALCRQAIDGEHKSLIIYRARESKVDSEDAQFFIGKYINPEKLLNYLKINPENIKKDLQSDNSPEYRLLRPNSGLCIKFT